ncbi:hypothetical protein AKUH4B114J_01030 [Apilactobacillus kunkeei]|nr:hypothetical protein AKUH3B101X_01020 [Apilactobacillus kunkeei]CAI2554087.1 hypothetical protein AKUH3B202M_01020 [Apilactobacillus kunkeei]CAI2554105.1 hypothetical protein AKUH4B114J_01030 [Apilactobacillus kunkeei]CAI2554159.1 hypothetical protein AKUH3B206M_01020 [Apilactobacillus kunkeei]CAI2554182.1 hypothetical protein AKUH2B105J_01020 [Apilactobacillus kunkeei]
MLKKIAFIRSIDIKQAEPTISQLKNDFIKNNKIDFKIYYSGNKLDDPSLSENIETFDKNIKIEELAYKIFKWKPDLVVSISLPDNNAVRDAVLKEYLYKKYNIKMVMHPIKSTLLLGNKWDTNFWLRSMNFNTSNAIHISSEMINNLHNNYEDYKYYFDAISTSISNMKKPLFVKPLRNSMSIGVKVFNDDKDIIDYIYKNKDQDYIIEEKINGQLYGMEALIKNKNIFFQPLVKKCSLEGGALMPFGHLRYGNIVIDNDIYNKITKQITEITKKLKLQGSVEFEFIVEKKEFKFVEINPRISGMTNLSSSISNINTFSWLINSNITKKNINKKINNFIIAEIPLDSVSENFYKNYKKLKKVISIQNVTYHNGEKSWKALFKGKSLEKIYLYINNLQKKGDIKIPLNIKKEFEKELFF